MVTEEQKRIRVGVIGGGPGAGIAETHRTAMRLDDKYVLVAGVFSRDHDKSLTAARQLRIDPDRVYPEYGAMAEVESKRGNDKIDAAVIVTPTNSHYQIAKKFLEWGIHVICVTGLEVTEVAAEISQIVAGRAIKDNANVLLRFSNGARGTLWASMAAIGNEHGLRIRVYGDRGSLAWHQEEPCHLRYCPIDGPPQMLAQGADWLSPDAKRWTRAGLGHPEGFFESFANLYTEVAEALLATSQGRTYTKGALGFPGASDGVQGVAFVESAMRSFAAGGVWTSTEGI